MEFWLTNGILHRSETMVRDDHGHLVLAYEDTGTKFDIPDEAETIIVPAGTVEIGQRAFKSPYHYKATKHYWPNVKKVILPDSVKKIGENAFYNLKLKEINFPDGLEVIESFAFNYTNLESVVLPDSIKEIGYFSFSDCPELKMISFPKSFVFPTRFLFPTEVLRARDVIDRCPKLETVEITENPSNNLCYDGCASIKRVTISEGERVKEIGSCQFRDCRSLEEIVIPKTVTKIRDYAFKNCESLTNIIIPSKVRTVDSEAFKGCTSLQSITLKSAFKGFETAFSDAHDVKQVYIPDSSAGKAKTIFPKAEIYNLKGEPLFSPQNNEGNDKSEEAGVKRDINSNLLSPAINGELIPKSNLHMFVNHEYDVDSAEHSLHIAFKGAQIANRICKAYYTSAAKGKNDKKLYDAAELIKANGELYTFEPHTGMRITTLSEDYERMGEKRSYSIPLKPDEIIQYVQRFSTELSCCLTETSITKITEYVPHKKNGTLAKNRTTVILKSGWADSEGNTLILIAKNVADNDLDLEVKKIYIGEEKYDESEAARIIGIVGSVPARKDKR